MASQSTLQSLSFIHSLVCALCMTVMTVIYHEVSAHIAHKPAACCKNIRNKNPRQNPEPFSNLVAKKGNECHEFGFSQSFVKVLKYLRGKASIWALAGLRSCQFKVISGWNKQEEAQQEKLQRTLIEKLKSLYCSSLVTFRTIKNPDTFRQSSLPQRAKQFLYVVIGRWAPSGVWICWPSQLKLAPSTGKDTTYKFKYPNFT